MVEPIRVIAIKGIPLVSEGDDIADLILSAACDQGLEIEDDDILVVAHSIVSKAEGRVVHRSEVEPSERAREIALMNGFDAVHVELALRESRAIVRERGALITETHNGLVCNFSGVDRSNAPPDSFVLLPLDPDASAERIQRAIQERTGRHVGVIISDTQGRPWRLGSVNVAIGAAGVGTLKYNRGRSDLYGRVLQRSTVCIADEIASAAEPMMGQADQGMPVVIVRGYKCDSCKGTARDIQRPKDKDLFR